MKIEKTSLQMCKISKKKNLLPLYLSLGSSRIISIIKTRIKPRKRKIEQPGKDWKIKGGGMGREECNPREKESPRIISV